MGRPKAPDLTPTERVIKRLSFMLRMHSKRNSKTRVRNLMSLPFNTTLEFEGVPLTTLMSPTVPDNGPEAESWFDAYLYGLYRGESTTPLEDLAETAPSMAKFVAQGEGIGEQATLLLWALGRAKGAVMTYDNDSIMVQFGDMRFGIEHGSVISRFCTGYQVQCHPMEQLETPKPIRVYSTSFCSLWGEAHSRGKNAPQALIAIMMGDPSYNFRKMAERAVPGIYPTNSQFLIWEDALADKRDPVARLYKHLVPKWMTRGEFGQVIRALGGRPLEGLTPASQQAYITKMHHYFYNKNKKEEL